MEYKILYHGTNTFFEEFSNDFLSTKDSIDQLGSGFYFYNCFSKTILHGTIIVTAKVEILKSIEYTEMWCPSMDDIYSLILKSPDLEDSLCNFGDINYEGFNTVLKKAVKTYTKETFYTNILNEIGNDFFSPKETHILLEEFIKITGINCITDTERGIYVILSNEYIDIQSVY